MPPKKATGTTTKSGSSATHASYRDMIKDAIINLKERNGSSRPALKKYVQNNNNINITSQSAFDNQFNRAVKAGVEKGEFTQPKGPSGTLKLAKKEPKKEAKPAAKTAAKKDSTKATKTGTTTKKTSTEKKPAASKTGTTKKAAAPKKATTAAKPKANITKPRKAPSAPAIVEEPPKVLGQTKSGRVTKSTATTTGKKTSTPKKAGAAKKTEKKATPKKSE